MYNSATNMPQVVSTDYWSATESVDETGSAWKISFDSGAVSDFEMATRIAWVLCIHD